MSSYRLPRFSKLSTLKSIPPELLKEFLAPYAAAFAKRGVIVPPPGSKKPILHELLLQVLMTPNEHTPVDLINALYLVDEMTTEEGMLALLDEVEFLNLKLPIDASSTPAEVAVQVWLADREIVERLHAQQLLMSCSAFEYFQSSRDDLEFEPLSEERLKVWERELNDWFASKRRGRGVRVFVFPQLHDVWFLIRHGLPFKREESLQGDTVQGVCYRPLKYDVAVFDRRNCELKINARLMGEKKLYCRTIGKYLFGDSECFPPTRKYTLDPLKEYGADALIAADVEGIESIRLVEIHIDHGGDHRAIDIHKARDVFASLAERDVRIPAHARLTCAVFRIQFTGDKRPRTVRIRTWNVIRYGRESDAPMVEAWLERRGFLVSKGVAVG